MSGASEHSVCLLLSFNVLPTDATLTCVAEIETNLCVWASLTD